MNYIKQLQTDNTEAQNKIDNSLELVQSFMETLQLDKFKGEDLDGSRKDWMSTADISARLLQLRNELL